MKDLDTLLRTRRHIRVIGFDDAPFSPTRGSPVQLAGVVCRDTRMEGLLWGRVTRDGSDATETLIEMLQTSKFAAQVHLVLIDGLAFGGFNLVDLPTLARHLERPCASVMRRLPDLPAITAVLQRFDDSERRLELLRRAGPIHSAGPFHFQLHGGRPDTFGAVLERLTDTGKVPEALRLAHLIGSAVMRGQSGRRA